MEPELSIKRTILGDTEVETTRGTSGMLRVAADRGLDWLTAHSRVIATITFVIRDVWTIEHPPLLLTMEPLCKVDEGAGLRRPQPLLASPS
jgi:hypothetical protein